jgi:hypothetical protein
MTRTNKIIFFLLVVGMGIYGCAKTPPGNARSESNSSPEARAQRWEEDFRAAAAARDQYRQKLLTAEEKQAQLQKQLDQERLHAASERETLKAELKLRSTERDSLQTQYDGFRKNLKDLLVQAEVSLNPNVPAIPSIPTIPVPPSTTTTTIPALIGSQAAPSTPSTPTTTGSALSN